jgi:hypothetical protein
MGEISDKKLRERLENPTPEMIAAAWRAFRRDNMGRLGPGPGFVEAIRAAGAAAIAASKEDDDVQ